jgi:hypothetical protein
MSKKIYFTSLWYGKKMTDHILNGEMAGKLYSVLKNINKNISYSLFILKKALPLRPQKFSNIMSFNTAYTTHQTALSEAVLTRAGYVILAFTPPPSTLHFSRLERN